ncbi:hypothetical protein X777_13389 [Ooceraea biroi]|uniref:Uncharacterized protein n=1 Tax=Ooceraea biroi TaxID=2015173 RepID=A0A026WW38_OOCBI|nr:hypothetical protein X777_13389 [Ooceraea biroi]
MQIPYHRVRNRFCLGPTSKEIFRCN